MANFLRILGVQSSPSSSSPTGSNGDGSSSGPSVNPLTPISTEHTTTVPTTLTLTATVSAGFTGAENTLVKGPGGKTLFTIRTETVTLFDRKTLYDAETGTAVGRIRKKMMDVVPTVYLGTPAAGDKVVSLKSKGVFDSMSCDTSISIEHHKVGWIEGNWKADAFSVRIRNREIATISRSRAANNKKNNNSSGKNNNKGRTALASGADTYEIRVSPKPSGDEPVDLAFLALIAAGLDELYHWTITTNGVGDPPYGKKK